PVGLGGVRGARPEDRQGLPGTRREVRRDDDRARTAARVRRGQPSVVTAGDGLVLALDQGSHASRAVLFDAAGREVAQAFVPVATRREGTDRVEQDAEELVRSLRTALQ